MTPDLFQTPFGTVLDRNLLVPTPLTARNDGSCDDRNPYELYNHYLWLETHLHPDDRKVLSDFQVVSSPDVDPSWPRPELKSVKTCSLAEIWNQMELGDLTEKDKYYFASEKWNLMTYNQRLKFIADCQVQRKRNIPLIYMINDIVDPYDHEKHEYQNQQRLEGNAQSYERFSEPSSEDPYESNDDIPLFG